MTLATKSSIQANCLVDSNTTALNLSFVINSLSQLHGVLTVLIGSGFLIVPWLRDHAAGRPVVEWLTCIKNFVMSMQHHDNLICSP